MKPLEQWLQVAAGAVHPMVLPFAILCGLVLAAVGVSFFAIARAKAVARVAAARLDAEKARSEKAIQALRETLDGLSAQLQEVRKEAAAVPAPPKPGFNLAKRSQALRMHRRGESTVAIAAALEISPQEVELLLKVHRIVISNL
jgi:DNA-binding NarL/FixJ family response regulator